MSAGTQAGPAIALSGVTCRFGAVTAVDFIDLEVSSGSFVALVGASGSGKSTLLKTINRLVEPDGGTVRIDSVQVTDRPVTALRRSIGYVFQNVGLFPHLRVGENIAIGLRIAGERETKDKVAALLSLVDLSPDIAERMPDALSGGQRQRVGVARALATQPGLLLMDEPFGALDPVTRDMLGKEVRALHEQLGLTTIMVTHDMAEALLIADRIVVMQAGQIVADATPRDLLAGKGGTVADALVAVPREQALRIAAMGT